MCREENITCYVYACLVVIYVSAISTQIILLSRLLSPTTTTATTTTATTTIITTIITTTTINSLNTSPNITPDTAPALSLPQVHQLNRLPQPDAGTYQCLRLIMYSLSTNNCQAYYLYCSLQIETNIHHNDTVIVPSNKM